MQAIESRCNNVIRDARGITHIRLDDGNRDALANSPLLRGTLPAPGHKLRGAVRLIEIEGVDINACGGTHLRSTAELQVATRAVLLVLRVPYGRETLTCSAEAAYSNVDCLSIGVVRPDSKMGIL